MRLQDMLHFLGLKTKMTRIEDVSIHTKGETIAAKKASDLKERVRIANEADNAILLSIHQNHFSDNRYAGAQVFYAKTEGSQIIANELQRTIVQHLNHGSTRQEKRSNGIYLMEHINCPGVLIECGFLSNPSEEAMLRNYNYQKQLSAVIACTISKFLSNT